MKTSILMGIFALFAITSSAQLKVDSMWKCFGLHK